LRHDLVGDVRVGVDVLHVVGVLESVDEAHHLPGAFLVERDFHAGNEAQLSGLVFDPRFLQGGTHRHQVAGLADDLERFAHVVDVLSARVEDSEGDVVLGRAFLGDDDQALAVEQVGHRARVSHGAAVAGDRDAHFGGGAVAVVGEALDEQGDAAGSVALVHDGFSVGTACLFTGAALAGTFDVVQRNRVLLRLLDSVVEGRVAVGVAATSTCRHLDVLDELREKLASSGVDDGLLVLGGGPFGVAGHAYPFTMSTKSRWTRVPPVSSGWNEVASSLPCRTATILPAVSPREMRPRTWTPGPVDSTHGARMKTASPGPPSTPVISTVPSKEATWRPKALRRTVMSMPPMVCWPGAPSARRSASMIMPAQVP